MAAGGGGGEGEGVEGRDVAGARHRELEAVDVETLLVSVGQQADKVVLLDTLRGEVGVKVAAGSP